jgi:hypothetical protein
MAGELQVSYQTGRVVYFIVRDKNGQVWDNTGSAFEAYATARYARYVLQAVEQGTASAFYAATFPAAIAAGAYSVVAKATDGSIENGEEADPTIATGDFQWDGSAPLATAGLVSSGGFGVFANGQLQRQRMVHKYPVAFCNSGGDPFTSGVCSGQISRDGGAFGPLQSGAFTEVGNGFYELQALTSGDLNAAKVCLYFSCAGISGGNAKPVQERHVFQRLSGI